MTKNSDEKFIAYALNLAKRNLGQTSPNPVVGCVIVKNGKIISSGVTAKNGRPHGERIAIERIIDKKILEGAEIYITLEPCSHHGQTAPCTDEIIKHKFKKAVIATMDDDERVNGEGIKKLREAGIDVICGVLEKEAREMNRGFFKTKTNGLPFVTLKLATSLDGKIATKNFDSKWISSEKARLFAHHLRSVNDAILVGAGTVRKDDPSLDCRILGLENFSPKKVIISSNIDFDLSLKIFRTSAIILTKKLAIPFDKLRVTSCHEVIFCEEKSGRVDLRDALKKLSANGINSVLVEGGREVATQFLKENLVDELVWIRSGKIIGEDGISAIGEMEFSGIDEVLNNFARQEIKELDGDIAEIYRNLKT